MSVEDYQAVSKRKLESNAEKIPDEWRLPEKFLTNVNQHSHQSVLDVPRKCGILTKKELDITQNHDACDLLAKMASKEYSSYEVVLAFCKRAAIAHQLVNCLTEIFFDVALDRADMCDQYLAEHGKTMGPLHGLPISLKDSFNVKGQCATLGYVSFASRPPADVNSPLVDLLLDAGAVCFVKTNIPQTMMFGDCHNYLFGRTLNPNKLSLTAGGSTGGEGALLKMRGSPLGVCTDVAGSIRIPALCNGNFGFKPTANRIPFQGGVPPGRLGVPSPIAVTVGPMGHSLRDMDLFMRVIIDTDPWNIDESVLAVPWRRVTALSRKLRLGFLAELPQRPLHPPMLRAMRRAHYQMQRAGHHCVRLDDANDVPDFMDAAALAWRFFDLDPKRTPLAHIDAGGEPGLVPGSHRLRFEQNEGFEPDLDKLWDMNVELARIRKAVHNIMVRHDLDGLVMPVYQSVAPPHDHFGVPVYTVLANLLNYPAVAIPVGAANKEADKMVFKSGADYEPHYHPDAIEGAPCGLQVIGRPMRDEELIQMAHIVAEVVGRES